MSRICRDKVVARGPRLCHWMKKNLYSAAMIELKYDRLHVSFPEVHKRAVCTIDLLRTLRVPDDDRRHPLPPSLGRFPMRRVGEFDSSVPQTWLGRGGILVPMYQAEALWLRFEGDYPFALKLGTQGINAINGEVWSEKLNGEDQDYIVTTSQPWIDGYCLGGDSLRQFTVLPLESDHGESVQMAGQSDIGGLRLLIYPLAADQSGKTAEQVGTPSGSLDPILPDVSEPGVAPGGQLRSQIYPDPWGEEAWDLEHSARCYVRMCNSVIWRAVTGKNPPQLPLTERDYESYGYPWIDSFEEPAQSDDQVERVKQLIAGSKAVREDREPRRAILDEKRANVLPEPRADRYRVVEELGE